ncbi:MULTISPECIES: iron chaperone [unclassified Paraflavitalea]|uniref:iron chaperone n=1 Tax=unclassified Paraflavitalea TaxID=2798305 RepID=UPI003D35225D
MKSVFATVDEYIESFPKKIQTELKKLRKTIKANAPEAEEMIAYGMPAYKLNKKPLVYFAGYEHHIGFYATPTGHKKFEKRLAGYKQGKGSVQFPLTEPMPLELVADIVQFRVQENNSIKKK